MIFAATSFAEATVVKKNAKGAKKWKTHETLAQRVCPVTVKG